MLFVQPISILLNYAAIFSANLKHWQIIQLGKKQKNAPIVRNLSPSAGGDISKIGGEEKNKLKRFETSVSGQKCIVKLKTDKIEKYTLFSKNVFESVLSKRSKTIR